MNHLELIADVQQQAEQFRPFLGFAPQGARDAVRGLEELLPAYAQTLEAVRRARQMVAAGRSEREALDEVFKAVGGRV